MKYIALIGLALLASGCRRSEEFCTNSLDESKDYTFRQCVSHSPSPIDCATAINSLYATKYEVCKREASRND